MSCTFHLFTSSILHTLSFVISFSRLRDFETPTLFYRIETHDSEVKQLAFSGDGLRLIDIRDSRSKIWEPAALVRKTGEEDVSVSESAIIPAITVGVDYAFEVENITALIAHPTLPVIFVGKSNGCVFVYDATTGKEKCQAYSHSTYVFVTEIACCENNVVASADAGSRVQAWKLNRTTTGTWSTGSFNLSISFGQSIRQLILSPKGEYCSHISRNVSSGMVHQDRQADRLKRLPSRLSEMDLDI